MASRKQASRFSAEAPRSCDRNAKLGVAPLSRAAVARVSSPALRAQSTNLDVKSGDVDVPTTAGRETGATGMLNLSKLAAAEFHAEPFEYLLVDDVLESNCTHAIVRDFPRIEKTGSFPLSRLSY